MSTHLSTPLLPTTLQAAAILDQLMAELPLMELGTLGRAELKSFGMLVTGMGEGQEDRAIRPSDHRAIGKTQEADRPFESRVPEARYAYYRRCHHFLRNGEQCKAPAMKDESICHQHDQQASNERRREQQRREFFSRPGVGFESFDAIQRTIGEMARAVLAGELDRKVAGRIMVDIQIAIRLQKVAARLQRTTARAKTKARRTRTAPTGFSRHRRRQVSGLTSTSAPRLFLRLAGRSGRLSAEDYEKRESSG